MRKFGVLTLLTALPVVIVATGHRVKLPRWQGQNARPTHRHSETNDGKYRIILLACVDMFALGIIHHKRRSYGPKESALARAN